MMDITARLERKKTSLSVAIMRYNLLRSKLQKAEIAIVEGYEDSIFYSAAFKRQGDVSVEHFFVAAGKDNVLGLHAAMLISRDILKGDGVIFFIDRDFDDLKGYDEHPSLYITPTYSFENIISSCESLRSLLLAEFKLGDAQTIGDVDQIVSLFGEFLRQHQIELYEANRLIYCIRQEAQRGNSLAGGSISDQPRKFAEFDAASFRIKKQATGSALLPLVSVAPNITSETIASYDLEFNQIDPATRWRGKFIYYLFKRFLATLLEDRNSKASPKYFSKGGGGISLDTSTDSLIRVLTSGCTLPECLKSFINQIPARRLK